MASDHHAPSEKNKTLRLVNGVSRPRIFKNKSRCCNVRIAFLTISHSTKILQFSENQTLRHATPKFRLYYVPVASGHLAPCYQRITSGHQPRSLRKSNTATCEWLVLPSTFRKSYFATCKWIPITLNTLKIKPCNFWKDSDDIQPPKVWLLDVRVTPYHFAPENQTKWHANGYRSQHALQTSSVTTHHSNVFRWSHILQKSNLHKAIRSWTHCPKVRLYDLRVTSDDLVSSENQRRDGCTQIFFW